MCVSVTCQCQDTFCRVLSTRVRAVRAETSGERGGWGGWAGRGRRLTRARSDAGSAEAARSTAPAASAPAVVARGDQSSNECRIRVPCLVRAVCPVHTRSTEQRTDTLLRVHAGKKQNFEVRSRAAGAILTILRVLHFRPDRRTDTEFAVCLHALASRGACPWLSTADPRVSRGYAQRPRRRPHCPYSHTTYVPFLRTTPSPMRDATCLPGYRVKDRSQSESLNFSALSPTCPRRLHHFMSVNTCAAGALASEHCPHTPT